MSEEIKNDIASAANDPKNPENSAAALQQQLKIQQQQYEAEQAKLEKFWSETYASINRIDPETTDFKTHELPLARIKKIMRLEDDLRDEGIGRFMISGDAPVILSKAAELFIAELTLRAGGHTEENKRRTLQRHDICAAVGKVDTYDFLIDIVPREDLRPDKEREVKADNAQAQQYVLMQQQIAQMGGTPLLPGVAQGIMDRGNLTLPQGVMTSEPLQMQVMAAMTSQNPQAPFQMQQIQLAWQQQMQQTLAQQQQQMGHNEGVKDNLGVLISANHNPNLHTIATEGQQSQHPRMSQMSHPNMLIALMAPGSGSSVQPQSGLLANSIQNFSQMNTNGTNPKEHN